METLKGSVSLHKKAGEGGTKNVVICSTRDVCVVQKDEVEEEKKRGDVAQRECLRV